MNDSLSSWLHRPAVFLCTAAEHFWNFLEALDGAATIAQLDTAQWRHISSGGEATKLLRASSFSILFPVEESRWIARI